MLLIRPDELHSSIARGMLTSLLHIDLARLNVEYMTSGLLPKA